MPVNRFADKVTADNDVALFLKAAPTNKLFRAYLTDDGSDRDLNENYAAATDCYFTMSRPGVIQRCTILIADSDVAQTIPQDGELFVGNTTALTNGFKFLVEDSAGTLKLDISNTVGAKTVGELQALCTFNYNIYKADNATTTANSHVFVGVMDFEEMFGRAISLNFNDRFVCVLQDNLTSMAVVNMVVSGFYL